MNSSSKTKAQRLPAGVMLNAYPDSIGKSLSDIVELLKRPEFKDTFSLFYILPTFFNSDLDRGFSIIDYDINEELVGPDDLKDLGELGIQVKLDLVLNHLSVRSPQFVDLLQKGNDSEFRDFFIDWKLVKGLLELAQPHQTPKPQTTPDTTAPIQALQASQQSNKAILY